MFFRYVSCLPKGGDGSGSYPPRCCGSLEVGFAYDLPTRILTAHILQAKDVPDRENGGAANCQVTLEKFDENIEATEELRGDTSVFLEPDCK